MSDALRPPPAETRIRVIAGPSGRAGYSIPYLAIVMTACIGTAISIAAGAFVLNMDSRIARLAFVKDADESLQAIQTQVAGANEALYALRDLFDATDRPIGRAEFQAFARRLRERFTGLRDTGWAPRVTKNDRAAFERGVQTSGFPDFVIKERTSADQLSRAADRDVLFPILYPDPVQMTSKVIGVDLAFEPVRRRALLLSLETRQPAATPPLRLISGNGGINGFMSFLPVFGPDGTLDEARGIVYGVFEIAPMIEKILRTALRSNDMQVYFYGHGGPSGDQLLYSHPPDDRGPDLPPPALTEVRKRPHWESVLHIANQTWVVIFVPARGGDPGVGQWPALIALGIGLVITGLIVAYLVMSLRRTAQLERLTEELRITATMLEEKGAKLAHVARHDPLTGLPNRMAFSEDTHRIVSDEPGRTHIAVLMLDLDRFKAINDTMGHAAGDILLRKVADRLRENLRLHDTVARLGGDEFAIVQVHVSQPDSAEILARRLVDVLCQPYEIFDQQVEVGVSIGIAVARVTEAEIDVMLRHADAALYEAKVSGRSTWRFSTAGSQAVLDAVRG